MKKGLQILRKINQSHLLLLLSLIVLFCAALIFYFGIFSNNPVFFEKYPEISYLTDKKMDFTHYKAYFKNLSEKKGAVYAFEILDKAPMPSGIDMHLLAHTVGDALYLQKGIDGMQLCTEAFRNACSHSIVINLFYEKGEAGLDEIGEACKKAPGKGAYQMCYHGLGHGVFAYAGYNFSKTTELCKKTEEVTLEGDEYRECMGGALMEQVSGGDHDKVFWQKQREINLRKDEPLYPCMSELFTDPKARQVCLVYLTPYLWELAGRRSEDVSDKVLVQSFEYCNKIPSSDPINRDACFGGFGKEFLAMAKGKDVRHIDKLTDEEMKKIYRWCLLTSHKDGQKSCVLYAQGSMYWSGANDKSLPEKYCSLAPTEEMQHYCYEELINTCLLYTSDAADE